MENITSQAEYSRLYRKLCRVRRLSYVDWKAFIDRTAIVHFKANEAAVVAGSLSTHSYFIVSGLMACYEGQEPKHVYWLRAEGGYAFTQDKFDVGKPRRSNNESLIALEDTVAISISHADFEWLCEHHHKVSMLISGLMLLLCTVMRTITNCLIIDSRQRYEWIQGRLGFNLDRVPAVYLSPYVRIPAKRLKELQKTKPVNFLSRY